MLRSIARYAVRTILVAAIVALASGHVIFGLTNFQPGFPILEGLAAVLAGLALLGSLLVALRSLRWALLTAWLGTLPLVAWFAYAVPVEGSSEPHFLAMSLIVPTVAGTALLLHWLHGHAVPGGT